MDRQRTLRWESISRTFLTVKFINKFSRIWVSPVAIFDIEPKKNLTGTSIFVISTSNLPTKNNVTYFTKLYFSFHPDDLTIAARNSACLADMSCWIKDHQLQLNLDKTELLVVSANS